MNITKITLSKSFTLLFAILLSSLSFAHHSSSEFSNANVEMEGQLRQINWRNPHPSLTFQSSKTEELWSLQLPGTIESLSARGISLDSFVIGQSLNISGLISRRSGNLLQLTHVLLPQGNELTLKAGIQPAWAQPNAIETQILVADDFAASELSSNISMTDKIFILFGIFIALVSAYVISTFRVKSLQASC
jgi:hypothetical protein